MRQIPYISDELGYKSQRTPCGRHIFEPMCKYKKTEKDSNDTY